MKTNAIITLEQKTVSDGSITYSYVGDYQVWLEFATQTNYSKKLHTPIYTAKGLVFFDADINLTDKIAVIAGLRYEFDEVNRFLDRNGNFHHIEAYLV